MAQVSKTTQAAKMTQVKKDGTRSKDDTGIKYDTGSTRAFVRLTDSVRQEPEREVIR